MDAESIGYVSLDASIAPIEGRSGSLVVPYRASLSNRVIIEARAGASVVAGARTVAKSWQEQRFRWQVRRRSWLWSAFVAKTAGTGGKSALWAGAGGI